MDPNRYALAKALFLDAVEIAPNEREAFVARRTSDDPALGREVRSLLQQHVEQPILRDRERRPAARREAPPAVDAKKRELGDPLGATGSVIDGRYRVIAFVAEGGFGYVYRAAEIDKHRDVALKFLKHELATDHGPSKLKEAFLKEGALLTELSDKSLAVVECYRVGSWTSAKGEDHLFIALEWLDGQTLAELLRQERATGTITPWPLGRTFQLLRPIATALTVAHQSGIAHRDVKPSNIFLPRSQVPTVSKLLDFGVAKTGASDRGFDTTASTGGGFTLAYAAPEQLMRSLGPTGPWTDVYSLALVCIELMLGRHPLASSDISAMIARTCDESQKARPTPQNEGLRLTEELEFVFEAAVAVNPKDRFVDVQAFWNALSIALGR